MSVKKSKNDFIRAAMGIYLRQKRFMGGDKFRKSDFQLVQTKKQFMMQKMLEADLHGANCFTYSNAQCLTNNHHLVDQQFYKFTQFVEQQSDSIRNELRRFYAPLICHLYLELIKAREPRAAVDFIRKYAHLVAPVDTYEAPGPSRINITSVPNLDDKGYFASAQQSCIRFVSDANPIDDPELVYFMKLVQTLSTCQRPEAVENDAEILHFRSSKYEIHTTAAVSSALNSYLEKRGHVLILSMFYNWLHINIIDNEVHSLKEDKLFMPLDDEEEEEEVWEAKSNIPSCSDRATMKRPAVESLDSSIKTEGGPIPDNRGYDDKKGFEHNVRLNLQVMREAKEQFFKEQTEMTQFIKLADTSRDLTSADVDPNECHFVTGLNSSVIQLWQMSQHCLAGKNFYRLLRDAECPWELNNCSREEFDDIEEDIKTDERTDGDGEKRKSLEGRYEGNSYNQFGGLTLRGHSLGVTDVRFSIHYPLIFSVAKDSTMRCWRAEDCSCGAIYRGHRYPIWCFDESPVNMYAATGSKDLTARLWSLDREFPVITYVGHKQDVEAIAFHPNGNYIATGSADHSVRMWDVTSGRLARVFTECKQPVSSVAFSPDGRFLAAGGEETKIRIFDIAAGSQLCELKDHTAPVTSLTWYGNSRQLVSACRDATVRLWDVKKLSTANESGISTAPSTSSAAASSSSSSSMRLLSANSKTERLVKVRFNKSGTVCCLGV